MQVTITVVGGAADGLQVRLQQFPATLGREGDPALPIADRWASRHHCELFEQAGCLFIRDLASKHGTYVNGAHVDERGLDVGDRVMVGLTLFTIDDIVATSLIDADVMVDHESSVGA
jgi:pSer/pThr/pTyr-binding forkhead associated (FHA) protein